MTSHKGNINWQELGVFTDEAIIKEILVIYFISILACTVFYYLNKAFYPSLMRLIYGENSGFFQM